MLGQSKNSTAEQINIVRDLTARQRQREADMVKEACRKNLERSVEEVEQNMVYKVVGRKGDKREIKVPLRVSEVLDPEGRVTMGQGVGRGARSEGHGKTLATGANREPLGQQGPGEGHHAARPKPDVPVQLKSAEKGNKGEQQDVSGDWQPASGKRGRPSPSPDKIVKKVKGGGVLELKNRFQKMAEEVFGVEATAC
jgi:hypothetical protein